ncbi:MAG: rRNA pseudouridine synthase [Clostridiales bacterium]|nr:rRNA pseudouridine synthase [Clostridiales bacterium]
MKKRIDKILSEHNICTRSQAPKLLKSGAVKANGACVLKNDEKFDTDVDVITVNGNPLNTSEHIYIMMNKPQGVVSATQDNLSKTVVDILPKEMQIKGIFPAGRLDKDACGLLILTNDGEFAHNMLSPKKHVYKRYYAKTDIEITSEMQERFKEGIVFSSGQACLPALLEKAQDGCFVTVCEGKFHQVKKMLAVCGAKVLYLKRLSIGALELDNSLAEGECRELEKAELDLLLLNKNISL